MSLEWSGAPALATFPGPGGRVAFVSGGSGTSTDIWTMDPDGTDRVQLTNSPGADASPDGTKIVFVRSNAQGPTFANPEVWVMNADGSNEHQLTTDPDTSDQTPAWSPDGTQIVFASNRADPSSFPSDLYVMDADGSNVTRLTNDPADETQPDWSPDGTTIAYASTRDVGFYNIWTVNPDGSNPVALTNDDGAYLQPAWWPDGSKIAFAANPFTITSTFDIWTVPAAGGPLTFLFTTANANEFNPAPSPTGTGIFFDTNGVAPDGTPPEPGPSNVVGCDVPVTTCTNGGDGFDPSVQPITTPICPVEDVHGRIQPTQAVWQDDRFWRGKKLGNQLVALSPTETIAQIPMVEDKPALLFGYEVAKGDPQAGFSHSRITIEGTSTGTKLVPVRMRFSSQQTDPSTIGTTQVLARLRLGPPCREDPTPFEVTLQAPEGVPLNGGGFRFPETGFYEIGAELVRRDGTPTGIRIAVGGNVVTTRGPNLFFQGAVLTPSTPRAREQLATEARDAAKESRERIPDYYPLAPGTLPTISFETVRDLTAARIQAGRGYEAWLAEHQIDDAWKLKDLRKEAVIAEITRAFALGGSSSGAASRVVIVLRPGDMSLLASNAVGLAASQKVIFASQPVFEITVGHELAHTMPHLWSVKQMKGVCGYDFHNHTDGVANGFQVTRRGNESRVNRDHTTSLMEAGASEWIDLCTYANLATVLQAPPDPPVLLVQGRLARARSTTIGELFPAYAFDAAADLTAGTGGRYAIVLTGVGGVELGRFPFAPRFATDRAMHDLISFQYRVPALPGTAGVRLIGPHGILDELSASATTPSVAITTPLDGSTVTPIDGTVRIEWTRSDLDGDALLSSVLYSPDGGETWITTLFESDELSFDVPIVAGGEHVVRVLVTDGMRSADSQVAFST